MNLPIFPVQFEGKPQHINLKIAILFHGALEEEFAVIIIAKIVYHVLFVVKLLSVHFKLNLTQGIFIIS